MQFHKVMAPVFARLGIKLITRNISQGGLGTLQNALAAGSIYGDDMDLLIWDSGMTERSKAQIDLFFRQVRFGHIENRKKSWHVVRILLLNILIFLPNRRG